MDTLDKIEDTRATRTGDFTSLPDTIEDIETDAAELVDTVAESARKVNWWKVAGYAAAGLAVAGAVGGYLYVRANERKPQTRLGRLRGQLGLEPVDFSRLPASLRDIDFNRVRTTGRQVGAAAKKATHAGAKKIAQLTR